MAPPNYRPRTEYPEFVKATGVSGQLAELMKSGYTLRQEQFDAPDGTVSFTTYLVNPAGDSVSAASVNMDPRHHGSMDQFARAVAAEHEVIKKRLEADALAIQTKRFIEESARPHRSLRGHGVMEVDLDESLPTAPPKSSIDEMRKIMAGVFTFTFNEDEASKLAAKAATSKASVDAQVALVHKRIADGSLKLACGSIYQEALGDGTFLRVFEDVNGHTRAVWHKRTPDGQPYEETTVFKTSPGGLGDSKEQLQRYALELAKQLSQDLRTDPERIRELREGGQLARDIVFVIAGVKVSMTVQLEGLGEEPTMP